jgi:hypothetical protein
MTADVQASLRKLSSLSKNLNEASDALTAELNSVETALNKLKLGVSAWVQIRTEELGSGETGISSLGYYKLGGKWGLVLYQYLDGMQDDSDDGVIPLREAPRDLRIEAAEKLDDLLEKLAEQASKTTDRVARTAAQAKEIASALSKGRT